MLLQHLHLGWELGLYAPSEFACLYWCRCCSHICGHPCTPAVVRPIHIVQLLHSRGDLKGLAGRKIV